MSKLVSESVSTVHPRMRTPSASEVASVSEALALVRDAGPDGPDGDDLITTLHANYRSFVHGYVTGLLADRHLAEDVVQETMIRAWQYRDQFRAEKGSVRGWLMKVAHNIAMDKIRMRRSRPPEVAEDAAPDALAAEDHADAVVTSLLVRRALARLSPGHRAVIEEIYLNGCTAREAVARLGIPEGTVFSRSYYALRKLRQELSDLEQGQHEVASAQPPARRAS
jgi:RNA polymerase sigma-70 factor, ECF subfamily